MYMPLWAQLLIAGAVSLGVIVVARANHTWADYRQPPVLTNE
jgi:hypothetical protein